MNRRAILAILCGVLPLIVVHYAYWLNIYTPGALDAIYQCNPYFEGCVSVSRAARSGPGLFWFKVVMLPVAMFTALSWRFAGNWMEGIDPGFPAIRRWVVRVGIGGAVALVFYVVFLGTDGEIYSWMRRYGVVFFFGFTALAQLLVVRFVWECFDRLLRWAAALLVVVVSLQWVTGVFSVLKRLVFDDPGLIDQMENITEWLMIVLMSFGFILIGALMGSQNRRHFPVD